MFVTGAQYQCLYNVLNTGKLKALITLLIDSVLTVLDRDFTVTRRAEKKSSVQQLGNKASLLYVLVLAIII